MHVRRLYWCIVFGLVTWGGCAHQGIVDDGTSLSYGPPYRGSLRNSVQLAAEGEGYWIPSRWAQRGLNYGTDELVRLVVYVGRQLSTRYPDAKLAVADLAAPQGGRTPWHRSHQTGRDVDLLFQASDQAGQPVHLDTMFTFTGEPRPKARGVPGENVFFDVPRNWYLVRTLIDNPIALVQYIFIADSLKQQLLDYARDEKEPEALIAEASYILHQPSDSLPHGDHMHVRIYCAVTDVPLGCKDYGVLRWTKKSYKYRYQSHRAQRRVESLLERLMRIDVGMLLAWAQHPLIGTLRF